MENLRPILEQTSHVINLQGKVRNWVIFLEAIYIHNSLVNVNIELNNFDQSRWLNYSQSTKLLPQRTMSCNVTFNQPGDHLFGHPHHTFPNSLN